MKREVAAETQGIFVEYVRLNGRKNKCGEPHNRVFFVGRIRLNCGRRIPRFRSGVNDTPGTV